MEETGNVVNWEIDDTAVPAHHNDKDKINEITAAVAIALKGTGGNGKISSNKWITRSGNDENIQKIMNMITIKLTDVWNIIRT